jgi:hypothetical protein
MTPFPKNFVPPIMRLNPRDEKFYFDGDVMVDLLTKTLFVTKGDSAYFTPYDKIEYVSLDFNTTADFSDICIRAGGLELYSFRSLGKAEGKSEAVRLYSSLMSAIGGGK